MDLALGTVQFGLIYGVGGGAERHLPPDEDVRRILEFAFNRGMRLLDTAPAYGNIESRLGYLCADLDFKIVSKIPPIPSGLDDAAAGRWVVHSAQTSRTRLGPKLYALLFHRAEDLLNRRGEAVFTELAKWAATHDVLLGASGYDAAMMRALFAARRLSVAQLPGSALDQRIGTAWAGLGGLHEVHLRSAFLQGLLLIPIENAMRAVPSATVVLRKWQNWLQNRGLSPAMGALSVVKSFKDVKVCIVGVDNISQLQEIQDAWSEAKPIPAPELACDDINLIDPRLWTAR